MAYLMNHLEEMKMEKKNPKNQAPMLLVDGSNLAYRAYSKFETFKDYKGRKIGLVYGFLKILESYIFRFHPKYTIVTFDTKESKESNFRKALWGSYKEHRKKNLSIDYESFEEQLVIVRKILKYMNIPVVMDTKGLGHESDDYIGYIALKHSKARSKVTIVSSDKDFCQLIDRYVRVYNPFKNILISKNNCLITMGYSPDECVDYLCLVGDKSDDIPGYRGIGEVKTRAFLDKFGSIQNFLDNDKLTFSGIDREALEDLYERNTELIDIHIALKKHPIKNLPIIYHRVDRVESKKLKAIFEDYKFFSMTTNEFFENIKKLKQWQFNKD